MARLASTPGTDEQGSPAESLSLLSDIERGTVTVLNNRAQSTRRDMAASITASAFRRLLSSVLQLAHSEDVAAQQRGMLELSTALRSAKGPLNVSRVAAIVVGPSNPAFVCLLLHRSVSNSSMLHVYWTC